MSFHVAERRASKKARSRFSFAGGSFVHDRQHPCRYGDVHSFGFTRQLRDINRHQCPGSASVFLAGVVGFERRLLGNRFPVHQKPFKVTSNGFVCRVDGIVQGVASRKAARQIGHGDTVDAVAVFVDDDWKSHQRSSLHLHHTFKGRKGEAALGQSRPS